MNKLKQLEQYGQSVWLDFLSREFLASDKFRSLINDDGLKGMTSNPSIFEKAFAHGTEYDADIAAPLPKRTERGDHLPPSERTRYPDRDRCASTCL